MVRFDEVLGWWPTKNPTYKIVFVAKRFPTRIHVRLTSNISQSQYFLKLSTVEIIFKKTLSHNFESIVLNKITGMH